MKNFTIKTQGTCARQIEFGLENGRLHHIHFQGGCSGNLSAISKLLEGADARRAVDLPGAPQNTRTTGDWAGGRACRPYGYDLDNR